jgi:hypothetical protein
MLRHPSAEEGATLGLEVRALEKQGVEVTLSIQER